MSCDVRQNAINTMKSENVIDEKRAITNKYKFSRLNEELTKNAEKFYNLDAKGELMFTVISPERQADKYDRIAGYSSKTYYDLNDKLFDELQRLEDLQASSNTKSGVQELFESNPELANEVYEALGFETKLKTSLGKELEYKDPYVPTGSLNNFKQYQVLDEKNNDIGSVIIEYRGDQTVILHPKLTITGKGYGKDLYKLISSKFNVEIQEWNEGGISKSDSAKAMWDSLEKEGNAKRIVDEEQGDNFRVVKYNTQITPQQKQEAQQLYSQYLDTIFPDSKVKDIVYHISDKTLTPKKGQIHFYLDSSTRDSNNYKFHILKNLESVLIDKETDNKNSGLNNVENYIFDNFNYEFFTAEWYRNPLKFYNDIINKAKEDKRLDVIEYLKGKETLAILNVKNPYNETIESLNKTTVDVIKNKIKTDGIIGQESWGYGLDKTEKEIVVFEPEQIHILGSKKDIEGFKKFTNNPNNTPKPGKQLSLFSDEEIIEQLVQEGKLKTKCN